MAPLSRSALWENAGRRGAGARRSWLKRIAKHPQRAEFERAMAGRLPEAWNEALSALRAQIAADKPKLATRVSSQKALEALVPSVPEMVGGSADLTGSNNTNVKGVPAIAPGNFSGRFVHWGVREHGMAAAMNGMALHGGVVPYGGTFLVFSDYCRNAIRMSAVQHAQVVYVMTHDSIGLGEDGPTHQPVEHVMSLRMIPNLNVYRPADVIETAECWALSLETTGTPSVLALSRQNLPQLRGAGDEGWTQASNRSAKGAYRLKSADAARKVVLVATGSEVEIAVNVAKLLERQGIGADVVSMPCAELFDAQSAAYKADILPREALIV